MPPSHTLDFRPTETKEKKIAILSAISFLEANTVPYKRGDLYQYFNVHERTAQKWIVAASNANPPVPQISQQPGVKTEDQGLKPAKSGASRAKPISNIAESTHSAASRHTTGRNSTPVSKKRKVKHEESTPPPSSPEQLPTPPSRKSAQPRKRRQTTESSVEFGYENLDEYEDV